MWRFRCGLWVDGVESEYMAPPPEGLDPAVLRTKLTKTGHPGDAFSAGLYDPTQKRSFISDTTFSADAMPDDYTWYDIGSLEPSDKAMVWLAAAKLPQPGVPLASRRVLVDAIEISRVTVEEK